MRILAIESSCDETATAIIENGTHVLKTLVSSSASFHEKYGGILPELAARKQLEFILPMMHHILQESPLETIDAIAVTQGPGLIGSLLIGVETAKTLSFVTKKPLIPVNHVHAHIYANFIEKDLPTFPAIALVASGGHTELFFMKDERSLTWLAGTIDDAAGEAFDKTARLLGFENRGGAAIEEEARLFKGKPTITLPRPLFHDHSLNFSFSGLKTAVLREWQKDSQHISELAYEIQEAITDVLVVKTIKAAEQNNAQTILLAGGVAANQRLRDKFKEKTSINIVFPSKDLCTDNAVTIGSAAYFIGKQVDWSDVSAIPNLSVEINSLLGQPI